MGVLNIQRCKSTLTSPIRNAAKTMIGDGIKLKLQKIDQFLK